MNFSSSRPEVYCKKGVLKKFSLHYIVTLVNTYFAAREVIGDFGQFEYGEFKSEVNFFSSGQVFFSSYPTSNRKHHLYLSYNFQDRAPAVPQT